MIKSCVICCFIAAVVLCAAAGRGALLTADFESDPIASGWTYVGPGGDWTTDQSLSPTHSIRYGAGTWQSPSFATSPYSYYRVDFSTMSEAKAMWAAYFYDSGGNALVADSYSSVDATSSWTPTTSFFRGRPAATVSRPGSVASRLVFQPLDNTKKTYVDDVSVRAATHAEAATWADSLYSTLPSLNYVAPSTRGQNLTRTLDKLRTGQTVRIVMLGDSIINDTYNSAFETLIERMYPGSSIEVVPAVEGGKGMWYYKDADRVQPYVIDYQPDLVMLGGISNHHEATVADDISDIQSVIQQIRDGSTGNEPDILMMSDVIYTGYNQLADYRSQLATMAAAQGIEYLDMAPIWDDYIQSAITNDGLSLNYFRRDDFLHANDRGKQVVARMLEDYFAPIPEPSAVGITLLFTTVGLMRRRSRQRAVAA